MSMVFDIDLNKRLIVVVGAGKVALRKTKRFLKEGAFVTVIAPEIHPDFQSLHVTFIPRAYQHHDLENAFLVVAATSDPILNQNIINDANAYNCLTMCVHHAVKTNAHGMVDQKESTYHVAVSSNGTYPMASVYLLQQLTTYIKEHEQTRLTILAKIRTTMKQYHQEISAYVMRTLLTFEVELLQVINDSLDQGSLYLLVYHGSANDKNTRVLQQFHQRLSIQLQPVPIAYAFLSTSILTIVNQDQVHVFDYQFLLPFLKQMKVHVVILPMLLQKGYYNHQIQVIAQQHEMQVTPIPSDVIASYITTQFEYYQSLYDEVIFIYHVRSNEQTIDQEDKTRVHKSIRMVCEDQLPKVINKQKKQYIIPLYVLYGKHMESLLSYDGVHIHPHCLLDDPVFYQLLIQKLK